MKRIVRKGWLVASLCIGLLVAGCATYYKVADPQTGKEYYTQELDTSRGGAVKLKDARSGNIVTLQSSEVKEISGSEYKAALSAPDKPAPAAPAPAAAPAETPAPAPAPATTPAPAPEGQTK